MTAKCFLHSFEKTNKKTDDYLMLFLSIKVAVDLFKTSNTLSQQNLYVTKSCTEQLQPI